MKKLPPTVLISETNFHNAWARAVRRVLRDGRDITIGDMSEPKPIKDACVLFELTSNAIKQIEDRELHPQFPFRYIEQYCQEFTREYLLEYIKKPEHEQFAYLYFERLALYQSCFDQIAYLRNCLKIQIDTNILSNRDQAITWDAKQDFNSTSPPCLQRIWIRYLGDNNVEVHLTWRSRDGYGAFQANLVAIIDMLNREIVVPNNCKISRIVDFSNSFHVYEHDITAAERIKLVPINPQK